MRLDRLTHKAQEALQAADTHASNANNPQVQPEHLLVALLQQQGGVARPLFERIGAHPDAVLDHPSVHVHAAETAEEDRRGGRVTGRHEQACVGQTLGQGSHAGAERLQDLLLCAWLAVEGQQGHRDRGHTRADASRHRAHHHRLAVEAQAQVFRSNKGHQHASKRSERPTRRADRSSFTPWGESTWSRAGRRLRRRARARPTGAGRAPGR